MHENDLKRFVIYLPREVRELCARHGLMLGGGALRSRIEGDRVNDYDLFGPSKEVLEKAAEELRRKWNVEGMKAKKIETGNAITILHPYQKRPPVQFITRWLYQGDSALQDLVDSFDFTCCRIAVRCTMKDKNQVWEGAVGERFWEDLAARRLVYTRPVRDEAAGGSLLRMRKFLSRGYSISAHQMAEVMTRVVVAAQAKGLADGVGMEEETEWRTGITAQLNEVDPLTVLDGVEFIHDHEAAK